MSGELIELPEGWAWIKLGDVEEKIGSGATPRGGSESYKLSGIPLIRSMNVHFDGLKLDGLAYLDDKQANELKNVEVKANDVLLNITGASIGRVTQAPPEMNGARVNQHVCIIRTNSILDAGFLSRYIASPSFQKWIIAEEYGATRQALTKQMILNFNIPLPPLNEQKRIVAKIEELNDRTQRAKEALEAIPQLCDRFRQSVLAAAFRGDLTADWREQNPNVEPASVLLERIREKRLVEAKTEKQKENIEAIYAYEEEFGSEPLADDWQYITLEKLCHTFQYGTSAKSSTEGKVPVLRMGNLQNGEINWNDIAYTSDDDEIVKYTLKPGDVLFNRTNSPELVGKTSIYRGERPAIFAGYLIRIDNYLELNSEYLNYCLNTTYAKDYYWKVKTDGVSQSNINAQKLAKFEIPFCSLQEQQEIVQRIHTLFKAIAQIQQQHQQAEEQLNRLNQSILAKAFRGELVPQDPDDEPASVLLERIRAEREKLNNSNKKSQAAGKRRSKTVEGQGVLPGFE
ncbi:restriction endonuclease subunit S [Nostoc sp. MG11]|uniref:restriction endonuclease subunit S n=1 Tax=Nostoc sp. MG11 TaxID=2721166 RepID=UPI001D032EB1|nr:restriction endonuclease subunit S [Nostoc sp. MG11]